MVVVQQELELLQVDHSHIGRVQVDQTGEFLVGKQRDLEVGDDIEERKETDSDEKANTWKDHPAANSHYGNCAR